MADTHPCPVAGCPRNIPREKLMCYWHWRRLPPHLRYAVMINWRDGQPTSYYLTIRADAIWAVEQFELAERTARDAAR